MRKRIIQAAFFVAGGGLAVTLMPIVWRIMNQHNQIWLNNAIVNFIIGAIIF